jgi:hypothetical protein
LETRQRWEESRSTRGAPRYAASTPTRQLALLDATNSSYEQHWFDCEYGWHGTITVKERMEGSSSQRSSQGGADLVYSARTDGNRTLTIELPNKKEQAKGNADGKANGVMRNETTAGGCTLSIENGSNTVSSGAGQAALRKVSTAQGALSITFSGPQETGSVTASTSTRVSGANCSASPPAVPPIDRPLSGEAWRGDIGDTLADPYAVSISGSRTLTFQVNAAGVPVPARVGTQGDTVRIPAIPGLARAVQAQAVLPWLALSPPSADQRDGPTITMTITWNLQFGQP